MEHLDAIAGAVDHDAPWSGIRSFGAYRHRRPA